MSRGKKLTPTDKARAIKLYELGNSWRHVAQIMGLNHQVLSRVCGKGIKRSRHDVMCLAWKSNGRLGPRHLLESELHLYKKLRHDALRMSADEAVRAIIAMRELSATPSRPRQSFSAPRAAE